MKKLLILVATTAFTAVLMAGGDFTPQLSPVTEIADKPCKRDTVYIEKDAELMWQDQLYSDVEDGASKRNQSIGKSGVWRHAEGYCRSLEYAGYTDWRLPTSDELQHVHRIRGQVFTYFRDTDFWTSTPGAKGRHYVVYPADAYIYAQKSTRTNFIRCVRCLHDGDTKNGPRAK